MLTFSQIRAGISGIFCHVFSYIDLHLFAMSMCQSFVGLMLELVLKFPDFLAEEVSFVQKELPFSYQVHPFTYHP